MKKLLAMALCLVAVSGYAQKGKEKIAADFYGVDYSCVDVKGADEEPGAFIKAFERKSRKQDFYPIECMQSETFRLHLLFHRKVI